MTAARRRVTTWPSRSRRPVVGFIGLGRLGSPMAASLRRAGFELVVFDARPVATERLAALGARVAESASGLAAEVDILVTMLPGPSQVAEVMFSRSGSFQALREGSIWVDASPANPASARLAVEERAARGVAAIDAPVAGTAEDAAAGRLRMFVGGEAADVARARPVLEAMADPDRILHVGPRGAGYAVKLCLSLLRFSQAAAGAEALVLGAKAGVKVEALRQALGAGPAASVPPGELGDQLEDGDDGVTLDQATRDLALAVDLGRELGLPMELAALVEQLHRRAMAVYGDRAGERSIVRLAEDAAGIRLQPDDDT
jgi:3-hydroxyisobutyrate dehydrogenase